MDSSFVEKTRLLVVDDDLAVLEVFKGIFEDDYDVVTTSSGNDALNIIPAFNPDLVITDAVMPGVNGWQLCEIVKTTSKTSHIKVIMVSANAVEFESRKNGYFVGADDYIVKPFIHEDLQMKVQVCLRAKQKEDSIRKEIRKLNLKNKKLEKKNKFLEEKTQKYASELLKIRKK